MKKFLLLIEKKENLYVNWKITFIILTKYENNFSILHC